MIPLQYEGYELFSFVDLMKKVKDVDKIKDDELYKDFKSLVFDPEQDYYRKLCFLDEKHTFLTTPLRKTVSKGIGGYEKEMYYFKQSSAQNCILAYFSIHPANIRAFFKNVEDYCKSKYRAGAKSLINYYSSSRIEKIKEFNNNIAEPYRNKINDYWNVYLRYRTAGHTYIALGMLLLVSLLNTTVISFLPSIKRTVIFNHDPLMNIKRITGKEIVIRSAMSDNLFMCHRVTKEPMNGEDKTIVSKRILYTANATEIDLTNAVFEIEQVDKSTLKKAKDDPNYGGRMIGFLKKPLSFAFSFVAPFEHIGHTINYLKNLNTYYIKATFTKDGHKTTRYLSYINWYKESRLILEKEPTKCSAWYIDMKRNGKCVIIPYGTLQYNIMALDIPNATQTTYGIPMWLFPQNFTEAQRYYFHEIIR